MTRMEIAALHLQHLPVYNKTDRHRELIQEIEEMKESILESLLIPRSSSLPTLPTPFCNFS